MAPKQRKTEKVTFRLTEDQKRMLHRAAIKAAKDEGEFIRDLLLQELGRLASEKTGAAA